MDLFTYLMAKKGHNTHRDLFSYLLGKNAGGSGTYTTFAGTSLNISNTLQAKIKNIALEGNTSQDGTPTPDTPIPIKVVTGENAIIVCGSNLFDYTKHSALTLDSNGRITTTKYYTQDNTVVYKLKPNTKYTFSFRNSNMGFSNYGFSMTVNGTWVQTNTGKYTVTSDSNGEFAIKLGADSYNTIGRASAYIQLEEGTTPTSYKPYQSQNYPLSLGNIELAKIENYKDYIFKNVTGSPYYNAELELNSWYKYNAIRKRIFDGSEDWGFQNSSNTPTPRTVLKLNIGNYIAGKYYSNYFIYDNQTSNRIVINNMPTLYLSLDNTVANIEGSDGNSTRVQKIKSWLSTHNTIIIYPLATPTYEKITNTTLIQQLENINNARSYKDTTIIECTSASTDNETIGFSGEIKVTSVGLGNSLNTSLLSSNLQEETNTNDIQEEPNLDEIEEHNDEPIENEVS